MKIAKWEMQIFGKNLIHFPIFNLIFEFAMLLILQTAKLCKYIIFSLPFQVLAAMKP
jgi:hypothetical protein